MKKFLLLLLLISQPVSAQFGRVDRTFPDVKRTVYLYDDFVSGNTTGDNVVGALGWRRYAASGGSVAAWSIPDSDVFGSANLTTSTTSGGNAAIYLNFSNIGNGSGRSIIRFRMMLNSTSNVISRHGFGDAVGSGVSLVDGVYFYYDPGTSANWQIRTVSNSTQTSVTTSVAANTSWNWYRIEMTSSRADFYINDSLVGSITTNIPSGNSRLFGIVNEAWTTDTVNKVVWIDVFEYQVKVSR